MHEIHIQISSRPFFKQYRIYEVGGAIPAPLLEGFETALEAANPIRMILCGQYEARFDSKPDPTPALRSIKIDIALPQRRVLLPYNRRTDRSIPGIFSNILPVTLRPLTKEPCRRKARRISLSLPMRKTSLSDTGKRETLAPIPPHLPLPRHPRPLRRLLRFVQSQ